MKIAVTSPSFSKHPDLIAEMHRHFDDFKLNTEGVRFTKEELINYLRGYDAAIVGLEVIDREVIDVLPKLRFIAKYGVGLNNLDLDYCKEKNIGIGWTGGVNRLSVAEMVVGNAIGLLRNLYLTSNWMKEGKWIKDGGVQLTGKTVGIIGVGHIGKEVIRLLQPFRCKVLVNDLLDQNEYYWEVGAIPSTKETIFKEADVLTLHVPYTPETHWLIDERALSSMKKEAILINTSRGGIVDESALERALAAKQIGGAALDVFEVEPALGSALLKFENFIGTPHIGGNAKEAVLAMGMSAIGHLLQINEKD